MMSSQPRHTEGSDFCSRGDRLTNNEKSRSALEKSMIIQHKKLPSDAIICLPSIPKASTDAFGRYLLTSDKFAYKSSSRPTLNLYIYMKQVVRHD
jgi:hypothetical protein